MMSSRQQEKLVKQVNKRLTQRARGTCSINQAAQTDTGSFMRSSSNGNEGEASSSLPRELSFSKKKKKKRDKSSSSRGEKRKAGEVRQGKAR